MEAGEIRWDVDYESFVCSCAGRKRMEEGGVDSRGRRDIHKGVQRHLFDELIM